MKYVIYMNGEEPTTTIQDFIDTNCYFNILRKFINKDNNDD